MSEKKSLLAEQGEAGAKPLDLASLPVHFIAHLPRGRVFMHPDTPRSGVRDPWPPLAPSFTNWTGAATKPDAPAPSPARDEVREAALTRGDAMTLIGHAEYLRRVHGEEDMPRFFDGLARRLLAALAARGERGE